MTSRARLFKYAWVYKARLLLAVVCAISSAQCNALTALFAKWFMMLGDNKPVTGLWVIKFGIAHGLFAAHDARLALMIIVAAFSAVISVPRGAATYCLAYTIASLTNRVGTDVRDEMYAHLQTLPLRFFHRSKTGHLMSRMSNDVTLVQNSSTVLTQAIDGPVMIITGLAYMFWICWKMALLTILIVPVMAVAIDRLSRKIRSLTTKTQVRLADVSAAVEESVRGVRIVKSFGTEEQETKRFGRVNGHSLHAALKAARRSSVVLPAIDVMGSFSVALIILIGGVMVVRGEIDFPSLIQFGLFSFYVAGAAKQFGRLNVTYQQTIAGAERIFELLDTKSDLPEDPNGVVLKNVEGRVEFKDVCFEYNPGEIVLDDLSFTMEHGEIVAIVGPSGAGKSTISDLIPRFYDVTGGQILVEGHDVRHINTRSLREQIGMVPQETILFSGTIAENIAYGRPGADKSEIIDAAKSANADGFISALPNGYDTELGEAGVGLSGGERQRISIARALLKNPKILILDEATSSLDAKSEGIVQEALDRLMRGRSTLVIAHRLSTVKNADKILYLDNGQVLESGSFDDLVASKGLFAQLYQTQFRTKEPVE